MIVAFGFAIFCTALVLYRVNQADVSLWRETTGTVLEKHGPNLALVSYSAGGHAMQGRVTAPASRPGDTLKLSYRQGDPDVVTSSAILKGPPWGIFGLAAFGVTVLLAGGFLYFKRGPQRGPDPQF